MARKSTRPGSQRTTREGADPKRPDRQRPGLTRTGPARSDLTRSGLGRTGPPRSAPARSDPARTEPARTGPTRLGEPTLAAADWAEAALQLIAEAGLAGLTVDALARRLGVTKGSFYWHFQGRSDLLAAALSRWEQRTTGDAIAALTAVPDARRRLELILDASTQPPRARSLYAALAEGAEDPVVHQALSRVATARIGYLESCYRELGLAEPVARCKALLAYAAYRGLLQLAHEAPSALPKDWSPYPGLVREAFVPPKRAKG